MLRAPFSAERGALGTGVAIAAGGLALAAALVAVTVTGAGFTGSERLAQTVEDALRQTTSGVAAQGPAIARTDGAHVSSIQLDLTSRPGSDVVQLTHGAPGALVARFVSDTAVADDVPYDAVLAPSSPSASLAPGGVAAVSIDLSGITPPPGAGDRFHIELSVGDSVPFVLGVSIPAGRPLPAVILLP
jgi:hypothetical protein